MRLNLTTPLLISVLLVFSCDFSNPAGPELITNDKSAQIQEISVTGNTIDNISIYKVGTQPNKAPEKLALLPAGCVVTGVGASETDESGTDISGIRLQYRKILESGTLSLIPETLSVGKGYPQMFGVVPTGCIVTGIGMTERDDRIDGLTLYYRQYDPINRSLYGMEKKIVWGRTHQEVHFRTEEYDIPYDQSVITGIGLRARYGRIETGHFYAGNITQ